MASSEPKLTDKQRSFVREYVRCLNSTKAARLAGYEGNDVTLASVGYENLRKPQIRAAIDEILTANSMSGAEVIARINQQARGAHADYWEYDTYGQPSINFRRMHEDGTSHLVKEVEFGETGRISKLKFADSQVALRDLGKHHKLFVDRTEVTGENGGPVVIRVIRDGK